MRRLRCMAAIVAALMAVTAHGELLVNAGFETGDFTGWTPFGQGWRIGSGADASDGTYGAVDDVLATDVDSFRGVIQSVPVTAGGTYSAAVFLRTVALESSASWLEIQWLDISGGIIAQVQSPAIAADQPFAQAVLPAMIAPAGAVTASVRGIVLMSSPPASDSDFHIFDRFSFIEGPANALTNRGFETGTTGGWTTFGPGWRIGTGGDAASGIYGAVNDVLTTDTDVFRGVFQNVPVDAGTSYEASVKIRTVAVESSESWLEVQWFDAAGVFLGQEQSEHIAADQPFARVNLSSITAPAGAVTAGVRAIVFMAAAPSADPDFHIVDDLSFTPVDFRIGSGGAGVSISWDLTADAYSLDVSTGLVNSAWLDVSPPPVSENGRWVANRSGDAGASSFRLRNPYP